MYPYNKNSKKECQSSENDNNLYEENVTYYIKEQDYNKEKAEQWEPQEKPEIDPMSPPCLPFYLRPDSEVLDLLIEGMKDKLQDCEYYSKLATTAEIAIDKEVLRQIALDDEKHLRLYENIYLQLAGMKIDITVKSRTIGNDLIDEYTKSIFNELSEVEFTRKIYFVFADLDIRDMLYEIITDDQAHATKLSYLYAKSLCSNNKS